MPDIVFLTEYIVGLFSKYKVIQWKWICTMEINEPSKTYIANQVSTEFS